MLDPDCICITWARNQAVEDPREGIPMSEHAPGCPLFKQRLYKKVHLIGGAWFICTPPEATSFMIDAEAFKDNGDEYEVTDIWLTEDQFEGLPEFEGF